LINYPNNPTSEKGTRNLIMNSSTVNFEMSAEVWLPCAFVIEFEKNIEKEWSERFKAYTLKVPAIKNGENVTLKVIPYFAFANRGKCDMYVYIKAKK